MLGDEKIAVTSKWRKNTEMRKRIFCIIVNADSSPKLQRGREDPFVSTHTGREEDSRQALPWASASFLEWTVWGVKRNG